MGEASPKSIFDLWYKLQAVFCSAASSSRPLVLPNLIELDEMVYEVYRPPLKEKPEIEIVLFHGLKLKDCEESHITTWMSGDNSEMWPRTWLAETFPKARIITICYDSAAKKTNEVEQLDMFLTRENLLSALTSDSVRIGEAQCPIVLVGHCLGGLLLKELCVHANQVLSEKRGGIPGMQRIHDLFENLRGMFFYGTPHLGSVLGDELHDCFDGSLLAEIEVLNAWSARKNASFCDLKARYKWISYGMGESHKSFVDCLGKYIQVVPEASSRVDMDAYYSVQANHFNLCKPAKKQDSAFSFLVDFLLKIHGEHILRSGVEADHMSGRGYVVDHHGRADKVESMLLKPNAYTAFIVGLPGIGKTTLAQQVFHDISHSFAIRCFIDLDNFKDPSKSRKEVLKKIESALKQQVQEWSYDYLTVPRYLKGKKALIVLDNVQSQVQLDALSREIWLEGSNSRLVVTTTNSCLGSQSNTYKVNFLGDQDSRELFCHYAFQNRARPECLANLLQQVIQRCGNFPLSLKILGSYLSAKDVDDQKLWRYLLVKLENAEEVASGPDYGLWARLRPCYYALTPSEQEMFLDVSVVFSGYPLNLVKYMWSACRQCPTIGWGNLERGFLVSEDGRGRIWMHELLRNLGRSIACPQTSRNSRGDKWRRISSGCLERDFIAKYQGIMDSLSLELQVHDNERLPLRNTTLAQYVKLEYLILDGVEMTEGRVELPGSLVYLKWKGALFETCPVDFNGLGNLAVLDLQFCKAMTSLPPSVVIAKKLKWLELEGCQSVTKLPEGLYEFSDLEYLGLSRTGVEKMSSKLRKLKKLRWIRADQTGLARVPDAIGRLTMLETLNISSTTVTVLPESIGALKLLTSLNARNTLLSSLPESIGDLELLKTLDAGNTFLSALPERIGCLRNLQELSLDATRMESLPESLGNVVGLKQLTLSSTPLETLPDSICLLRSLQHLSLDDTQISTLPDAFGELESLKVLYLSGSRVRSLPETCNKLSHLITLQLTVSTILNDGTHPSGSGTHSKIPRSRQDLDCLVGLGISEFSEGEIPEVEEEGEIPAMSRALFSAKLPFHRVYSLKIVGKNFSESTLPTLFNALKEMTYLRYLTLEGFNEVEAFPSELGTLTGLRTLTITSWERLRELPDSFSLLKELTELELVYLPRLLRLPEGLNFATRNYVLTVVNCGSVQSMPRSFGHKSAVDRDSSPACSDECGNSYSNPTVYQGRESSNIVTDSWSLLRCLLECRTGQGYSFDIRFAIKCEEMETAMKRAVKLKGDLDPELKLATTELRKLCLECQVGDDGLHGSFTPSTIWAPLNHESKSKMYLGCMGDQASDYAKFPPLTLCTIHRFGVRVLDMGEEDSEGNDDSNIEDSDEDTEDREDNSDNIEEAQDIEDQDSKQSEDEEIKAKRKKLNDWSNAGNLTEMVGTALRLPLPLSPSLV